MISIWERRKHAFGFISTRFAGLDGVSLETFKWVDVLSNRGCRVFYMAGELETYEGVSHCAAKASFKHEEILDIHRRLFVEKRRTPDLSRRITRIKEELKEEIAFFHRKFDFDVLVVENALAIPLNIPLGLAITEYVMETGIPTIAHHHDFHWERERFRSPVVADYLRAAFPPVHPSIQHVVINSLAGYDFGRITGAPWILIPNVLNFKILPPKIDDYNKDFRQQIGIDPDAVLVLQPTRVVSRKGIETAIELIKRLDYPKACLVITHGSGDEGSEYLDRIRDFADFIGTDLRLIADRISTERGTTPDGKKIYTLWDAYLNADLVVYPSLYEGYGNAFVETIYCKKPIVINRYEIFITDIESKGFDVVSFDGYVTRQTIKKIRDLLERPDYLAQKAEKNYMLGWQHLSYEMLEEKFEQILGNIYGS